ncbi:MAG: hypothetical protein ACREO3_03785 [Arenimonas sp.]
MVVAIRSNLVDDAMPMAKALFGPGVMLVVCLALYRFLLWPLADTVYDDVDSLVVHRHGQEERVPLADILSVSMTPFLNPPLITLCLSRPGRFGERITFIAPKEFRFFPAAGHPVAEALRARVDRAQRREAAR